MSAECRWAAVANRLSAVNGPQPALARSWLTIRSTSAFGPDDSAFPPPVPPPLLVPVPPVWVGFFVGLVDAFVVGAVDDATGGDDDAADGDPESSGNVPAVSSPPGAAAGGGISPAAAGLPAGFPPDASSR